MIKNQKALSLAEATEYANLNEKVNLKAFAKKFTTPNLKDAKEIRTEIEKLRFAKLDEKSMSKIIDILPATAEDLHKVVFGINFDDDEIQKILNIVKEFK